MTAVAVNGTGLAKLPPVADAFPVTSYADAARHLRRPFTPEAVKFKVLDTWEGGASVVFYIDARLVVERLNLVCAGAWEPTYVRDGQMMWCHLSVFGVTRPDIGEGYIGKGLVSDALKRAAVQFGVGVSLYAVPKVYLNLSDGHIRSSKRDRYAITLEGENVCRDHYRLWLANHGVKGFGEALDHGDVEGAAGDVDAEAERPDITPAVVRDEVRIAPALIVDPAAVIDGLLGIADDHAGARLEVIEAMREAKVGEVQIAREVKAANDAGGEALAELLAKVKTLLAVAS